MGARSVKRSIHWKRLALPLRVATIFAAAGIILAVVGIIKGTVPANPISILLALLIL